MIVSLSICFPHIPLVRHLFSHAPRSYSIFKVKSEPTAGGHGEQYENCDCNCHPFVACAEMDLLHPPLRAAKSPHLRAITHIRHRSYGVVKTNEIVVGLAAAIAPSTEGMVETVSGNHAGAPD
jgi:hypothetical protein